ncbi:MAG TPA: hypothetical protein VGO91_13505 [Pyrinomonadaceae bacterium]|jgi:hypothetical protein|nr:hypothetical protein [Pyrinomonadaceae bacterium]
MPTKKREPSEKPTFVFKGTVKKVRSATMKHLVADDRTFVVRVDQILEAPKLMANYGGQEITVQLSRRQKMRAGQEMIFHTIGWIFGETVAVQSLSQEPLKPAHMAMMGRAADPVEEKQRRVLEDRFADSDVVVSGQVATVRLPGAEETTNKRRAQRGLVEEEPALTVPASEHNAHWREAVIEVHDVHKGAHDKSNIVINFPASTDVRWYKAPKFEPGQQGFFMLRKTQVEEKPSARKGGRGIAGETPQRETAEAYTALHPEDFQPYQEPEGIKRLIQISPPENEQ